MLNSEALSKLVEIIHQKGIIIVSEPNAKMMIKGLRDLFGARKARFFAVIPRFRRSCHIVSPRFLVNPLNS